MSFHYCLQVIRLEDLQWRHPLHGSVPDLYVEVTLGNVTRRTAIIKKSTSPNWDESLVFPYDSVDQAAEFNIQVKHYSSWSSNPCVGAIDILPADLISRCSGGEAVSLDLVGPNTEGMAPVGRIVVLLSVIDGVKAAEISTDKTSEYVRRSKIARLEGASDVTQSIDNSAARINAQSGLYRAVGKLLQRFDVIRQVMDQLSEIHPFLTIAWKLISGLHMAVKSVFDTDKRVIDLVQAIVDAFSFVGDVQAIPGKAVSLQRMIVALLKQTIECCLFIQLYVKRSFLRRMLDVTSTQKVDEFERSLGRLKQGIESGVNLGTAFVSMRSSRRVDSLVLNQRLNPTLSDTFDRPVCLPETRVEVRSQIIDWIFSETKQNVLWLHGVAGSGKSTISTTIVEHLRDMSRLGAFMFFEREKSQPSSVIRSIAYQLAMFDPSIESAILSETDKDNTISTASSSRQFDKLLLSPLRSIADSISGPILIALDGLDECGTPESRRSLMDLVEKELPKLPNVFRFMFTSRREHDIDKFLSSKPNNVAAIELDYSSPMSREDVHAYIRKEMCAAVREVVGVPSGWPWDENMTLLSKAAGGLFIWGSTAVKMVKNSDNPFYQLDCLITDSQSLAGFGLEQLYSAVLRGSGIDWQNKRSRERFVKVVSLLLLSKAPLTSQVIDGLLNFPPQESSHLVLSRLRSVLSFVPGGPVSLLHASFADYLMSPGHGGDPWFIDASAAKHHIIDRCFIVMKDLLRFNICDVRTSFSRNDDDPGLAGRVDSSIPAHLEYACLYWSKHLTDVDCSADRVKELSDFAYHRLLFWYEVLSLKKQFGRIATRELFDVASWVGELDADVASFLQDASKLASIFTLPIMESVPHIYVSMIPLSQDESSVSAHYSKHLRSAIGIEREGVKRPAVCLKVLVGHSDRVNSISSSPVGRRIASASWDKTVRVWDLDSGEETLQSCIQHSDIVWSVSFFPDGERLVSGTEDGTVTVWSAQNGGVVLGPLKGHSDSVWAVATSPDGTMFASGSDDETIIIWDASDGRIRSHLTGHTIRVTSLAFSPDSTRLVSGSFDETVRVWNVNSGELALAPFVNVSQVFSVGFSPDGSHVVSGSDVGVTIWNSKVGSVVSVLEGHTLPVTSVGYSPCGTRIVSGSDDRTMIVWDALSGEIVSGPLEGHSGLIYCVAFSHDGKYIVSGSDDCTVRVWDAISGTVTPRKQERHIGPVNSVSISGDGGRIASASDDDSIIIWDALSGDVMARPLVGHLESVRCVSFTPDSSRLISVSWNGTIWIRDGSTGELVLDPIEGNARGILCIAVSPDGTKVVSGSSDGTISVWDVAMDARIGPLPGHSGNVRSLAYSHDGKLLASGSMDGRVIVWDTSTWVMNSEPLRGHTDSVCCVSFSPDSTLLASGSLNGTVLVHDVRTEQVVYDPFKEHRGSVNSVVFLPDGSHVASGSDDSTIQVWNVKSGQPICVLLGHSSYITSLALSLGGTRLVSGSSDSTIRVWDVSDLAKHGNSDLAESVSSSEGDVSDWELCNDGWMRCIGYTEEIESTLMSADDGSEGAEGSDIDDSDYDLLLWIPPDLRRTLWSPRNTLILSCEFSTKIDFANAAIGNRWTDCFRQSDGD